jgi:hypothetical protein
MGSPSGKCDGSGDRRHDNTGSLLIVYFLVGERWDRQRS